MDNVIIVKCRIGQKWGDTMPPLIPPPKFEKRIHHVVPQGWQRRFRGTDSNGNTEPGPYYKNILTGQCLGPIGPGNRMAEEYANIVFDEFYRPSDAVEDRLSVAETRGINALSNVIALSRTAPGDKVDLAYFSRFRHVGTPSCTSSV